MKKQMLLSSIFLLLMFTIRAQRVDLDRFNFTVNYRTFPEERLPENYKTYNVRIEAPASMERNSGGLQPEIPIEGMRQVEGTGHITILAILDEMNIEGSQTRERIQVKKEKNGTETSTPFYSVEMTYSYSARITVYDYRGQTILNAFPLASREQKRTFKTAEFSTPDAAQANYLNKAVEIRRNLSRQLYDGTISNFINLLNQKFGYRTLRGTDILWVLNNRRHPEYRDQQKAWNEFRNAIVLMQADQPLDEVREKLQPVIKYFEKAKKRYTTNSKDDRKLRYASFYNLAKIYLWLDEPEKAMIEADALTMNDYDEQDGQLLRMMAENLRDLLIRNQASTRHFATPILEYESPLAGN